ncbi:hypothetical protein R3P38DRAFT_2771935 [Favolaschia claudopus]|uniref:Secreted protein n=1 Tax=Favolaschia claudopus TaxID=2862362 RepID=A0AAW0C700_9AGAR
MQLSLQFVALLVVALSHRAIAQVTFVVAPTNANSNCLPGTAISCGQTAINTGNCKGDFTPGQRCVHIASTHPGCHISLFTEDGQQGGVEATNYHSARSCRRYNKVVAKSYIAHTLYTLKLVKTYHCGSSAVGYNTGIWHIYCAKNQNAQLRCF